MSRLDRGRKREREDNCRQESEAKPKKLNLKPGQCPLSAYIEDFYDQHQQTAQDFKVKNNLREWIENCLERAGYNYTCYIVGSTSNGFGTKASDVDICLVINHEKEQVAKNESMKALKNCRRAIQRYGQVGHHLELIPAKVPILRFIRDGVQIDINCNNLTGLRNTWLLSSYSAASAKIRDPRVKQLGMFIKRIAKKLDINDPQNGTLSSYSINLMMIHYLQTLPVPILPCIQKLDPSINLEISLKALPQLIRCLPQWEVKNNQSLSDLLAGFFDYYNRFDYDDVISIRLGTAVPVNDPLLIMSNSQSFLEKGIRIEEPFEGSNTARAVWKTESVAKVKFALGKALKVIKRLQEIDIDLEDVWENDMVIDEEELEAIKHVLRGTTSEAEEAKAKTKAEKRRAKKERKKLKKKEQMITKDISRPMQAPVLAWENKLQSSSRQTNQVMNTVDPFWNPFQEKDEN